MICWYTHFAGKLTSYSWQDNLSSHQQREALFDEEGKFWTEIPLRVLLLVLRQGIRPSSILPMLAKPSQSKHIELWSKIQEKRSPRALDWTKCGHWHYILHPNVAVGKLAKTIRFCFGYWKPPHCINQITYSVCFSWRLDVTGCSAGECKQRPSHWWSSFGGAS
jgi:hypothetical protein